MYSPKWWWNMWVSIESVIFDSYLWQFFSGYLMSWSLCYLVKSENVSFSRTQSVFCAAVSCWKKYISHVWYRRFKEVHRAGLFDAQMLFGFVWCICTWMRNCVHERERKSMCACASTHLIMTVVGAMVTHQVGSGVRAAVLHLLSETLLFPSSRLPSSRLLLSPLLWPFTDNAQRTKEKIICLAITAN